MTVRILHVVTYMGRGGLETFLMNVYRNLDREKIQFDFLVHRQFRADYDDEIEALGGKIYRLPRLNPFSPGYRRALHAFFRGHPEYRIVHCHQDCLSGIPLEAAKQAGVPVRIAHSHNSNQDRNLKYIIKRYYMKKIPQMATHFLACSKDAGAWMFPGENVTVVHNAIDTEKFDFVPSVREEMRRRLGIAQKLVIGHVGRFESQKNHEFLIRVFARIHALRPDAVLLLVGDGTLREQIETQIRDAGLSDCVILAGVQSDVSPYYQAMDIFVMPSLFEGLAIVIVEAQTTGVPCVISDTVSRECVLTEGLVSVMNLKEDPDSWARHILSRVTGSRRSRKREVTEMGYDVRENVRWLETFYMTANKK